MPTVLNRLQEGLGQRGDLPGVLAHHEMLQFVDGYPLNNQGEVITHNDAVP